MTQPRRCKHEPTTTTEVIRNTADTIVAVTVYVSCIRCGRAIPATTTRRDPMK